jgi:hypothetical protein
MPPGMTILPPASTRRFALSFLKVPDAATAAIFPS